MKLIRIGQLGSERPAVLIGDGQALDASAVTQDYNSAFFAGDGVRWLKEAVDRGDLPPVELNGERLGAPIATPPNVLCIGLNYVGHAREAGMELPEEPLLFSKTTNTVVGPYDDVLIPRGSTCTDWEVELGVVIGARGRYLEDEQAAAAIIAGYTLSNDVSERAFQLERGGQWIKGKSCETFNPLGPWLATADEIQDVQKLDLSLDVNGKRMQSGSTDDMVFSVYHLVWYLSQHMVLEPGDLINTGTPAGVGLGHRPPKYLRAGDVMELTGAGLGHQRQALRDAP